MSTGRKGTTEFATGATCKTTASVLFLAVGWLVFLLGFPGFVESASAADGTEEFEKEKSTQNIGYILRLRQQEELRKKQAEHDLGASIPDLAAAEKDLENLNNVVSNAMNIADQTRRSEEASNGFFTSVVISAVLLGGGILLFRMLAPQVGRWLKPWIRATEAGDAASMGQSDEKSFMAFATAFRVGPNAGLRDSTSEYPRMEMSLNLQEKPLTVTNPLKELFDSAPKTIAALRNLLQEITRTTDELARQKSLLALCEKLHWLTGKAALPEVLPVWQMAAALEGLVNQLTQKTQNVTSSTLRTVASAVDLLEVLCRPNVRPDLAANPPIRLLAVDDDAISRHAVSLALRKALNKPDLAENGEAALALASQIPYDAIFLDVQMPGMDGFETCKKIHATEVNRTTPVVFVTCLRDFDARAKSTLSGGNDLIGKPFLIFEITVKALTLAFRGRLEPRNKCHERSASPAAAVAELSADVVMKAFLAHAPEHIRTLRKRFEQVEAASAETRPEQLVDLYLAVHSLRAEAELAKFGLVFQLSSTIEALLKKLLEDPNSSNAEGLPMIGKAVDMLGDLCASKVGPDLTKEPTVQLLSAGNDLQTIMTALKSRLNPDQQETAAAATPNGLAVAELAGAGK